MRRHHQNACAGVELEKTLPERRRSPVKSERLCGRNCLRADRVGRLSDQRARSKKESQRDARYEKNYGKKLPSSRCHLLSFAWCKLSNGMFRGFGNRRSPRSAAECASPT